MNQDPLVLLHLSDIHFRLPRRGPAYDLDHSLIEALGRDLSEVKDFVGTPSAILITGDIAFAGKKEEYASASAWLEGVCTKLNCPRTSVLSVPGNHDVDRDIIKARRPVRDARECLRTCDLSYIDAEIEDYLSDPEVFYAPLAAYNSDFAAGFECEITREKPVWKKSFPMNDGSVLMFHGLNSVLISESDEFDGQRKLALGRHQYHQFEIKEGLEHVVLCHHPPDWFREQDEINQSFYAKTRLQLFGHKHRFDYAVTRDTLRLAAGAVGPCRREPLWEPRYNWITVTIDVSSQRTMRIALYPRVWNQRDQGFSADFNAAGGKPLLSYNLHLPPSGSPSSRPLFALARKGSGDSVDSPQGREVPKESTVDNPIAGDFRVLTHRYFSLSYVKRMQIADELELHAEEDAQLGGVEIFIRHLERCKERNLLKEMWDIVERLHNDGAYSSNPYDLSK